MVSTTLYKGGYVEIACLAADTKPTDGIATGSICVEVDTGKVYFYDSEGAEWVEQFSFQPEDSNAKSVSLKKGAAPANTEEEETPAEEEPNER